MRRRVVALVLLIAAAGLVGCSRLGKLEVQVGELQGNMKFLGERFDAASKTSQTLDAALKQATTDLASIKQSQADLAQAQADLTQRLDELSQSLDEIRAKLARTQTDCCGCPVAAFGFGPAQQTDSMAVSFVDRSQDSGGDIEKWAWAFGDEGTADVQSPTHTYGTPGHYVVRLTVTDAKGCSSSAQQEIGVPLAGMSYAPDLATPVEQPGLTGRETEFPIASWTSGLARRG